MRNSRFYNYCWPKLSYLKQVALMRLPSAASALRDLVEDVLERLPNGSVHSQSVHIRNWVNQSSVHLIDEEHDSYAFQLNLTVQKVRDHLRNGGSKPHLSCGPRAYLMKEILKALGIQSRVIDLFEIVDHIPQSHTLLEVYLSDENRWVLQDPDFNAEYISKSDGRCLSAKDCLAAPREALEFNANGHLIENRENLIGTVETYFDLLVLYRYSYQGRRSVVLFKSSVIQEKLVYSSERCQKFGDYLNNRDYSPKCKVLIT